MPEKQEQNYSQWYETFYPALTNYGMWLKGHEINTVPLKEYESRPFKVLFTRLSTYNDVSSSFTHLLLYQLAAEDEGVFPDIAYLPPENDAKIFEKYGIPWLIGTQTKLGPKHFSLIGFSNSIIQELINIPRFLATSGIPLKRSERLTREDVPLIILGGANALYTTSILGEDALVDGIFIGCNPSSIKKLLRISADGFKNKKTKSQILSELEELPDFYGTSGSGRTIKNEIYKPGDIELLEKGPIPYNDDSIGKGYLQISEGCRALCSFCAENWARKPYRELTGKILLEKALVMKAEMGLDRINIFSFNFNMHSEFYKLLWDLSDFFHSVNFKSQRFDMLANTRMIECQFASGKTTFSAAMEGISMRLRRYLNKNLNESIMLKSMEHIFKLNSREIKIFLLSTGLENDDDFKEFEVFLNLLEQRKKSCKAKTRVIFSITPLVRFPWTPLEFDDAPSPSVHDRIIAKMRQSILLHTFEAREAIDPKEYLVSQILVRASDERIKKALLNAISETNFVYYLYISTPFFKSFIKHLEKEGLKIQDLLKGFSYKDSFSKSWALFDMNIDRGFLWHVYQKNIIFQEIGAPLDRIEIENPPAMPEEYRARFSGAKTGSIERHFLVNIKEMGRGIPRKYIGTALARAIMKSEKTLIPHFRHYVSSYWAGTDMKPAWIEGEDILTLAWGKEALAILEKKFGEKEFMSLVNSHFEGWGLFNGPSKNKDVSFSLHIDSPYEFNDAAYFKSKGLKYTLYKNAHNSYNLKFTNESLKKNIIRSCNYIIASDATAAARVPVSLEIVPGGKFDPEAFAREAFTYPGKNDWVRITIIASLQT